MLYSRPLARLAAGTALAAFLIAQSWVVCAPLCLLEGHAMAAMAWSPGQHCHSDNTLHHELPVLEPLSSMLPVSPAQLLPLPSVVTSEFAPPPLFQLQQIPPAEPPPPRSV